jgi:N-methylhydantoinase A
MDPTVTDVDLILGYLDQRYFLGGREPLNAEKARAVFQEKVAEPLGMHIEDAAGEVYRLTNSMIYDMLHKLTVERGLDPRSYILFSTGGTAGMHVGIFAQELNVQRVIVPHSAAVHGALGLVSSEISYEEQVNRPIRVPGVPDEVNELLKTLEAKVRDQLGEDGFGETDTVISRAIEMRYRRQVHVVTVPLEAGGSLSERDLAQAVDRFDALYEERFGKGSGYREAGIEMVNFRVRGVGLLEKPALTGQPITDSDSSPAFVESRQAYFGRSREFREASCYDFAKLSPGNKIEGPAIIWSPDTTIVVNPGQSATCDPYKNIEMTW